MRFGLSPIAGSTQPESADSLRHRAFNTGSCSILFGKLLAGFSYTGRLQREIFLLWPNRQGPAWLSCVCTLLSALTRATISGSKFDLDNIPLTTVFSWRPTHAATLLWANSLLLLPIDLEVTCREAFLLVGLPMIIGPCRP
jgi:hypothetical protein